MTFCQKKIKKINKQPKKILLPRFNHGFSYLIYTTKPCAKKKQTETERKNMTHFFLNGM